MNDHIHAGQLCYLDASRVESPAGGLEGVTVETQEAETLGKLDGVLIDPSERRLRYLVVEVPGRFRRRRFLISADHPVWVEQQRNTLMVDAEGEDLSNSDEFDLKTVRQFSADDAVTAMFAR
jgi:hypothetical protein